MAAADTVIQQLAGALYTEPALLVRGIVFIDLGEQLKSTTIVFLGLVRVLAAITPTIAPMPMRHKIIPVNDLSLF
jgi:hypothetical protein